MLDAVRLTFPPLVFFSILLHSSEAPIASPIPVDPVAPENTPFTSVKSLQQEETAAISKLPEWKQTLLEDFAITLLSSKYVMLNSNS